MKRGHKGWVIRAAAAVVVLAAMHKASAGLSFTSGTLTLVHDYDVSTVNATYSSGLVPLPASSLIYPASPWQLENIVTTGRSSTYAAGSVGEMANSQGGGIVLASGTTLTQDDQDGGYVGARSLKFNIDATWNVTDSGLGPLAFTFGNLTAGGEGGGGGLGTLSIDLKFLNESGSSIR